MQWKNHPFLFVCPGQIERKLYPKEPFFTTLGGGGEGGVYIPTEAK